MGERIVAGPGRDASAQEPPSVADRVFEALVRMAWAARRHDQSLARRWGVTATQLSALRVLERAGELSHGELAARLFLGPSTLTDLVDRLEARGLVRRRRSTADRRQVHVSLDRAGRARLREVPRGVSKFGALRRMIAELPPAEAAGFLAVLERMGALLGEPEAGGPEAGAQQAREGRAPRRRRAAGARAGAAQGDDA